MSNDNTTGRKPARVKLKRDFDSAAMLQPGGAKRFDHLYRAGYRLRGVVSLKRNGSESKFDPIAVALLSFKHRKGNYDTRVFVSVIHERGGEWFYGEAMPYTGAAEAKP